MSEAHEDAVSLEQSAEKLITTVRTLNQSIETAQDLRDDLNNLTQETRQTRRLTIWVTVGFIFNVILTIAVVVVLIGVMNNNRRINEIVEVQRDSALCPLYVLFLNSDTQASRDNAEQRGDNMTLRAEQFRTIRDSYEALNCEVK